MSTKILDSSLMIDEKRVRVNWLLIGLFAAVVVIVIFHKQIASMLGIGG
jgi:uncharacterized membrane protein